MRSTLIPIQNYILVRLHKTTTNICIWCIVNYCKNDKPHTLLLLIKSEWCTEKILETPFEELKKMTLKNVLNGAMLQFMLQKNEYNLYMLFSITELPQEWAVAITLTRSDLHLKQEKGIRQQYQKRQDKRG